MQARDEQWCIPDEKGWGGRVVIVVGGKGGWGRSRDDCQTPFSQIHCLPKVVTDGPTHRRTDKASYRDTWTLLRTTNIGQKGKLRSVFGIWPLLKRRQDMGVSCLVLSFLSWRYFGLFDDPLLNLPPPSQSLDSLVSQFLEGNAKVTPLMTMDPSVFVGKDALERKILSAMFSDLAKVFIAQYPVSEISWRKRVFDLLWSKFVKFQTFEDDPCEYKERSNVKFKRMCYQIFTTSISFGYNRKKTKKTETEKSMLVFSLKKPWKQNRWLELFWSPYGFIFTKFLSPTE